MVIVRTRMCCVPALALLAGCGATALTPAASSVQVIAAPAAACSALGEVSASMGYNGQGRDENVAEATITLKNKAAALGADAIVITSKEVGRIDLFGSAPPPSGGMVGGGCPNCVAMKAGAYRCAPASAARK